MGRTRLPTRLKALRGTLRRDRMNPREPRPPVGLPPTSPRWPAAKREQYRRVRRLVTPMRVATMAGGIAAEQLAEELVLAAAMAVILTESGATYDATTQTGSVLRRARPEVAILADARRRIVTLQAHFSLTPASRAKVEARAADESIPFGEINPLDRLRAARGRLRPAQEAP